MAAAWQACSAAEAQLREAEGSLRGLREGAAREAARAQALERKLQVGAGGCWQRCCALCWHVCFHPGMEQCSTCKQICLLNPS